MDLFILFIKLLLLALYIIGAIFAYRLLQYLIDKISGVNGNVPVVQPQQTQEQLYFIHKDTYLVFCDIMIDCVGSNYSSIGLCKPGAQPQHMAPDNMGVTIDENERVLYHYLFDRSPGPSSGGIGKNTYSTFPANDMKKKLNSVLGNYCVAAGYAPHKITQAEDVEDGRVKFTLV